MRLVFATFSIKRYSPRGSTSRLPLPGGHPVANWKPSKAQVWCEYRAASRDLSLVGI